MMPNRIDVHSHLIPGVDDGCQTVEESIACARLMVSAGYTHSFCTPHIHPDFPDHTSAAIAQWTATLQKEFEKAAVPLTLLPGGEINIWGDLSQTLSETRVATYGGWNRHCLVDMWADALPDFFAQSVKWLQSKNLTVILGHPERMKAVQRDPALADKFAEMGVLLQGNLQCFSDPPGSNTRTTAEKFLKEGRYFMLGSDLHRMASLPARLAGLQFAIDLAGKAAVDKLTVENPKVLMG